MHVVQDESDELDQGLFLLIARRIRLTDGCAGGADRTGAEQRQKVAFEDQAQDEQHHHPAQAKMDAAYLKTATAAAFVSAILNIIATATGCPAHSDFSLSEMARLSCA